jgi:hypothetical protein
MTIVVIILKEQLIDYIFSVKRKDAQEKVLLGTRIIDPIDVKI